MAVPEGPAPGSARAPTLLTDLYQLTMALGYWKRGIAEREACFHLTFRTNPFGGGFAVACGLAAVADYLDGLRFDDDALSYLASVPAPGGGRLFEDAFLGHLDALRFACDVAAVPEGTVVFPGTPLLRVTGPLLQAQIVETALLTLLNFPTLVATKAARVRLAAGDDPVIEFGLRRAQGVDGGVTASRAAYVGGCDATSNVLAGRLFGIPVGGTHAHSWVMAFDSEEQAFEAYADALPRNCTLLVDTYDTARGVARAIETGRRLRAAGHSLLGVRLDSGDLGPLARQARAMLDEAGFPDARIVASGDLDEHRIAALKEQGVPIGVWGVGTRLATAHGDPALGGVYKLAALRGPDGSWQRKIKRSDDPAKSSVPGLLDAARRTREGVFSGDVVFDVEMGGAGGGTPLLAPLFERGRRVADPPPASAARERARAQVAALPPGVRRLRDPEAYPVALEPRLAALRDRLAEEAAR